MKKLSLLPLAFVCGLLLAGGTAVAAPGHYESLADIPMPGGYSSLEDINRLKEEIFFQRAVQSYIWALPALNLQAMKEGKEKTFGPGYHVLPIWKDRLNAKTLITTPNSDVIYGLGFFDLKADGPLVVEVPPGMQGILDDVFQRPICSDGPIDGKVWCGDVGLPGPDKGKGGKYLLLPPDYRDKAPEGYLTFRSRSYTVMLLLRDFFKDPKKLDEPVKVMERTRVYPLRDKDNPKAMQFPNASQTPADMLYPRDGGAFDMLARIFAHEYVDPADMEMRGMLAAIGIIKGKPFAPTDRRKALLDAAGKVAGKYGLAVSHTPLEIVEHPTWYTDRRWLNPFPGNADFTAPSFNYIDPRTGFFTNAFTASPGMAITMEKVGAKYPATFVDARGEYLTGGNTYKVNLPKNVPAAMFWSLTVYDSVTASQIDNGQPFSSINSMDKPRANADGSTDVWFGPDAPGEGKNWIRTLPGKGYFVILRLYGPEKAFFDQTWRPGDMEKQ